MCVGKNAGRHQKSWLARCDWLKCLMVPRRPQTYVDFFHRTLPPAKTAVSDESMDFVAGLEIPGGFRAEHWDPLYVAALELDSRTNSSVSLASARAYAGSSMLV
jgi:hypothetical protein